MRTLSVSTEPPSLDVAPLHAVDLLSLLGHLDRRGGNTGKLDVCRAGLGVLFLPETPLRVGQEIVGRLLRERVDVGSLASVDGHIEVEGLVRPLGVLEGDPNGPASVAGEGMLVHVPECDARDDEPRTARNELDGLYHPFGGRVAPPKQPVPCRLRLDGLRLSSPAQFELALVAGHEGVFPVGHGEVGKPYPESRYPLTVADDADLVPLAYGNGDGLGVLEPDDVVRDVDADGAVFVLPGLHLPVCDDDIVRRLADRQRDRPIPLSQRDEALPVSATARRANGERQAPHGLLAQHRVLAGQGIRACVAQAGNVDGFIVHGLGASGVGVKIVPHGT